MSSSPYAPAAKILNEIWTRKKGLKTVVYSKDGELKCSTSTYAICCHVLKYKGLLSKLLKEVSEIEAKNQGLLYILLYELLMGPNKMIRGGGALKRQIMSHIDSLQEHFQRISDEEGWKDDDHNTKEDGYSKSSSAIPRYVRINTLVADRDEVIQDIRAKADKVYVDPHVPDLLVLEHTPKSRALLQDLVLSKKVILQDKSSCFSALCMVHGFEDLVNKAKKWDYLDACAAPGNKTSHLAALVSQQSTDDSRDKPTIHALDKSSDRYKLLKRRMGELVPQGIVQCHNEDFFEISKQSFGEESNDEISVNTKAFQNLQAIMLDPSCSGSGMTSNHTEESVSKDPLFCSERIQTLSNFQFQALHHATTDFPAVDRVVYSTCSLYVQENEGVVQRLLASNDDWELISPKCLKSWHRRGLVLDDVQNSDNESPSLTPEQAKCLIRVHPDEDGTNGFFVACFQRKKKGTAKAKSSSNNSKNIINVPKGMEVYKNQFHVHAKTKSSVDKQQIAKKEQSKTPSSAGDTKGKDTATKTKRKANQISSDTKSDEVTGDESKGKSLKQKLSKKRAKKLEWKKCQRLKKEARLKSQVEKNTETV